MDGMDNMLEQELDFSSEPDEVVKTDEGDQDKFITQTIVDEDDIFGGLVEIPKDDLVSDLLKARGITDNKLKILNDQEEEEEVDFFSLSREEQIEILNAADESSNSDSEDLKGLADKEKEFIEYLRKEGISLDEYLKNYKEVAISEAGVGAEDVFDIDAYTDEELFLLDLKSRYEDLSDEELKKELETALKDEEIFKKKIGKTREEYKQLEAAHKEDQAKETEQKKEEQYDKFIETMVDVAIKNPEFHGIELEDDEKNDVLSYLLELDDSGTSEFSRALNDPKRLYEAAWFLKYGKEAFDAIRNAYETEIKTLKKDNPQKQKQEAKAVIKRKPEQQEEEYKSIYDLGGF